jgi:hypothetical protein
MPVCWKCPSCNAETCHTDYIDPRRPVSCGVCDAEWNRTDVLCTVCETPNALMRRDSLHYWCLTCGNTQTLMTLSA